MKLLIFCVLVFAVSSYKPYQTQFPNGRFVQHPCLEGRKWPGVGHTNVEGGSTRNPFGIQFSQHNHNWTAVCGLDADGDGLTNGEELGDPNCSWNVGDIAPVTSSITHPGVCEPMESSKCQEQNKFDINCEAINQFECEEHDSGVFNVTFKFDRTKVPAEETTYICQRFDLPYDKAYHLIGSEPLIDNGNVMHHIVAYGCPEEVEDQLSTTPDICFGMPPAGCVGISGWTFGAEGPWCPHSDIGLNVGKGRYKYLYMQYHWNNPTLMDDQYDESALKLFFTPNIRAKHGSTFATGNFDINIPPNTMNTIVKGTCSSKCTQRRIKDETMYVFSIGAHMHLLGTGAALVQKRDGQIIDVWFNQSYDYTAPKTIVFDPPKEIKGGDEIYSECRFNSQGVSTVTRYGDGTQEEMCFIFMGYYPESIDLTHCINGLEGQTEDSCLLTDYFEYMEKIRKNNRNKENAGGSSTILPTILPFMAILSQLFIGE